ncbi:hypothetical protein [Vibrio europaeus]|uniref:Uncharacterized protein n=1 Tax=Vibrio europaeus TaxID=300876 RepID=A0ABT5H1Z9_9VIBR|nr:hypothetical protein [Vibrio europaeus]MDC5706489.1 hypothetical protein [Vibrio europaeus]MDC5711978.1 hypothetical protein [Vibrio europaeus]MDC5716329.1 hypothetical protein [Vibrio europaeus]MDC5725900.1 hypothetical protein [Vibrio europaeus]MDC5732889.1 hypothetical protein [Vibrio europaeus]
MTDSELEKAKKRYTTIHAWDMVADLSQNIENAGTKVFLKTVREKVGTHSFDTKPDLNKFEPLFSDIVLSEECKKQWIHIKDYYKKYKL